MKCTNKDWSDLNLENEEIECSNQLRMANGKVLAHIENRKIIFEISF